MALGISNRSGSLPLNPPGGSSKCRNSIESNGGGNTSCFSTVSRGRTALSAPSVVCAKDHAGGRLRVGVAVVVDEHGGGGGRLHGLTQFAPLEEATELAGHSGPGAGPARHLDDAIFADVLDPYAYAEHGLRLATGDL